MTTTNEEFKIDQLIGFLDNTNHSVHPPSPILLGGGGGQGVNLLLNFEKVRGLTGSQFLEEVYWERWG